MIAHIWKFSEVKEMHFTLLLISLCFIAINGGPITTTPTEETDGDDGFNEKYEDLNIMMNAPYPVQKEITKYFVTFNNSNLLSVAATCKSLCEFTKKMLNKRMKPLIITNGTIDQQIFSIHEQNLSTHDFLMLQKWQPEFALFFDNETSKQYMSRFPRSFQIVPHDSHLQISFRQLFHERLINNHPRSAVIIPKFYNASVDFFFHNNRHEFYPADESKMRKAKLIIVFGNNPYIESHNFRFMGSHSVSICYASQIDEPWNEWISRLFVIFSGSNIETSTFLVETTDEEKLRKKLLIWKSELDFLESHHIIPFHFTKKSMKPTNSEEIFREIFGIQPVILRLSDSELAETGVIYCNSTTKAKRNPGPVYAIVGYKKF